MNSEVQRRIILCIGYEGQELHTYANTLHYSVSPYSLSRWYMNIYLSLYLSVCARARGIYIYICRRVCYPIVRL
jgi:hypothetical protein